MSGGSAAWFGWYVFVSHTAVEPEGNKLKKNEDFRLKNGPESGLDCLMCAGFARQRPWTGYSSVRNRPES